MELRPGYKQTEVGVIPEEWFVKPLKGLTTEISDGIHSTPEYVSVSDFYFVNGNNFINDEITVTATTLCVSEAEFKSLKKPLTEQTLLFSINGTIGNLAFYRGEKVVLGKSAAYINVAKGISKGFISYCLKSKPTALFFENELTGTTIRNLSLQSLRNTPIPCPPTPEEQCAIATALSEVDALIGALDRLIAKKRDLKHAAMQQLFTGQTRLPGFSETWETMRLGEIGTTYGGLTGKTKADFGGGSSQYIPFLSVIGNTIVDPNNLEQVRISASECQNQAKRDDLFFNGSSETPEEIGMCAVLLADFHTVYLNSFCFGFRVREGVEANGLFLAYFFRSGAGRKLLYFLAQGATRYNLSKTQFLKLKIPFPRPDEQTAIATVLSDIDAEIAALEARRDKTRVLKQGMMQELLIGRIRLI